MAALGQAGHVVIPIAIDADLTWRSAPNAQRELAQVNGRLPSTKDVTGGIVESISADIAFPVLHGVWGEDGGVQQALTDLKLPFVGSGIAASQLAMDKAATKLKLIESGISVVSSVTATENNWQELLPQITELGNNLFVKPCHGGSSLGVTHVTAAAELESALTTIFEMSDQAIIEQAIIKPREIEIGVLQQPDGSLIVSVCGEIELKPEFDFYDYQAKYLADGAELIVPASIGAMKYQDFLVNAKKAFLALGCAGLARVDFLMAADGSIYLNEVNTMPGFTQISMYPKMFAATGIELPELVDKLVQHGLAAVR